MTTHDTTTPHVLPIRTYLWVYFWLMLFLIVTVAAAYVDLKWANFAVTMVIAVTKGVMIALIFMHVRYNERLIWVFSSASFVWLMILFVFSLNDYYTRDLLHIYGK